MKSLQSLVPRTRSMAVLLVALAAANTWAIDVPLDPHATFLRTDSTDTSALAATPINLASLGITPGDTIRLELLGDWDFTSFDSTFEGATALIGVFSSTATLLDSSELNRVPGAIDAGTDVITGTTLFEFNSTDINQDFAIDNTILQVPSGAAWLFVAASDSFYSDNLDADNNFGVRITAVPDSGSSAGLLLAALSGLCLCSIQRNRSLKVENV